MLIVCFVVQKEFLKLHGMRENSSLCETVLHIVVYRMHSWFPPHTLNANIITTNNPHKCPNQSLGSSAPLRTTTLEASAAPDSPTTGGSQPHLDFSLLLPSFIPFFPLLPQSSLYGLISGPAETSAWAPCFWAQPLQSSQGTCLALSTKPLLSLSPALRVWPHSDSASCSDSILSE